MLLLCFVLVFVLHFRAIGFIRMCGVHSFTFLFWAMNTSVALACVCVRYDHIQYRDGGVW